MRRVRGADGRVNFTSLKRLALSPAHYKAYCEDPPPPTRNMRIGTVSHHIVLGPRQGSTLVCYPGTTRSGKKWEAFAEEHAGAEIVTQPEWDQGARVADAVRRDPVAAEFLAGCRYEVPLSWEDAGIECRTGGVDCVGERRLGDLKTTAVADPSRLSRLAASMYYHAQLAFYETGARANGIDTSDGLFLIVAEITPPYAVTVAKLAPAMVDHGRRQYVKWLERLQACEENDFWPAYSQSVVDLDLPEWLTEDETPAPDPEWVGGEESAA